MVAVRLLLAATVFLPLLAARHALAAEDDIPSGRVGTFVADAPVQDVDAITQSCPASPPGPCGYNYPVRGRTCKVEEIQELGRFGDDDYLVVRYLRETVFDEGQPYGPFTCASDEVVLAAVAGGGKARVVWRDATERTFYFISSVKLARTPGGESILAVLYCLNGTGGCAQGMLIWGGDEWRKLERDDSWQEVYRNLPAGYRQHKSPEIDFSTLTWEQHLAQRDDANCCPSGRIHFQLAIVGGKLAVKSYRIVVPAPEATEEAVDRLLEANAADLAAGLAARPFGAWLDGLLPEGAGRLFEIANCGAVGAASSAPPADPLSPCLAVDVDVVSRDRNVRLLFERESLAFRGGEISSPGAESGLAVRTLAELPQLLKAAMRLRPLACPNGTIVKSKENNAGLNEWCEDAKGRRQGPYRSWFSTGIYLMAKGQYRNDRKTGDWVECSRFEVCEFRTYRNGQVQ